MSKDKNLKVLRMDTVNPNVKAMEYAVRGPIVMRANEIELDIMKGDTSYPFDKIMKCNIGDAHATGQKPITFIRQLMATCLYPEFFVNDPNIPDDCKQRADRILNDCRGRSIGSYSNSEGLRVIRDDVAKYIEARDGCPASLDNIILTAGASDGIKIILNMLMTGELGKKRAGIMIPVPQYPLYSATITEYNAYPIYYHLDEDNNWGLNLKEIGTAYSKAKSHCQPRAICVINPGNPTGQVLTKENISDIIKFAKREKLFVLADEVYQHNIFTEGAEFYSFKKILTEMGPEYSNVELVSFMSVSKGYMGECGFRGGYMELINIDPEVKAVILKSITARLCPPLLGQIAVEAVVNPPVESEPSYDLFMEEKSYVLNQLQKKARLVSETFKSMDGFACNEVQGAMYCFPRITIPEKAINEAKKQNMSPDSLYCYELLENTGICVIPGSGFGQRAGTHHFRITILPPEEEFKSMVVRFKEFHSKFLAKYH